MIVVSDSTPLIHLSAVSDLHLLERLFGTVTVPAAVLDEVVTFGAGRRGSRHPKEHRMARKVAAHRFALSRDNQWIYFGVTAPASDVWLASLE